MTDGNTATQVGPIPTEEDMSKVRQVIEQGLNALVGMSQLSSQVQALEAKVNGLVSELDYMRDKNAKLDELVTNIRTQRDDALNLSNDLRREVSQANNRIELLSNEVHAQSDTIERQRAEIADLKAERDKAQYEALEAKEKADNANFTLNKMKELIHSIEPQPEPVLQSPVPVRPVEAVTGPAEPAEPTVDWDKPTHWNATKGHYENTPAEPNPAPSAIDYEPKPEGWR